MGQRRRPHRPHRLRTIVRHADHIEPIGSPPTGRWAEGLLSAI